MIHIYCGDGKGKTTAACGLALRAAGHGQNVLFVQFFKDGSSGEITAMKALPNIETRCPSAHYGRFKTLTVSQREQVSRSSRELFKQTVSGAGNYALIVLDEALSAYRHAVIDREELLSFLRTQGSLREIVLTGRNPAPELLALADYVTEMRKEKHPFDRGVPAREGVEY